MLMRRSSVFRLANKFTPADILFELTTMLYQETKLRAGSGFLKTMDDIVVATRLVSDLLSQAISHVDYFDDPKSRTIKLSQVHWKQALRHIDVCLDMGCIEAVGAILRKLSPERFSNGQWGRDQDIARYTNSLISLLPQLEAVVSKLKENRTTPHRELAAFYRSLVVWYAKGVEYRGSDHPITSELLKMVELAVDAGSLSALERWV